MLLCYEQVKAYFLMDAKGAQRWAMYNNGTRKGTSRGSRFCSGSGTTWTKEEFITDFRDYVLRGLNLTGPITRLEPECYVCEVLHMRINMVNNTLDYDDKLYKQVSRPLSYIRHACRSRMHADHSS
jgi:hypothetical protein